MLRTRLPALAALAGALLVLGYVGMVDPREDGHYPPCPVPRYTGLWCPGCGGLRSVHALVHGDLGGAFAANAVAASFVLLAGLVWTVWLLRPGWRFQVPATVLWGAGCVVVVFTVLRNLPVGDFLAP